MQKKKKTPEFYSISSAHGDVRVSLTQTIRLLSVPVALAVIAVAIVTGAHNPAKMICALLLTGGAGAHVIVCRKMDNINSDILN